MGFLSDQQTKKHFHQLIPRRVPDSYFCLFWIWLRIWGMCEFDMWSVRKIPRKINSVEKSSDEAMPGHYSTLLLESAGPRTVLTESNSAGKIHTPPRCFSSESRATLPLKYSVYTRSTYAYYRTVHSPWFCDPWLQLHSPLVSILIFYKHIIIL